MDCKHEHLKCVNNTFFCLDCGAEVPDPAQAAPKEEEKKPVKRRTKKEEK